MKKRYLLFAVIAVFLVLVPSCKKKDDPSLSVPVVKVAEEKTEETISPVKETEVTALANPVETEEKSGEDNRERKLSMVYRGGKILLKSTFLSDEATISTNLDGASISSAVSRLGEENAEYLTLFTALVDGSNVILSYSPSLSDDVLHSFWDDVKSVLDRMNEEAEKIEAEEEKSQETEYTASGIPLSILVYPERADVTLPSYVEESDLEAFFSFLSLNNPALSEKARYTFEGNKVSLLYGESMTEEDVPLLWNELVAEIEKYMSAPALEEEEAVSVASAEAEEKKTLSSPLSAAGKTLDRMSVSLSLSAKYDPTVSFASVIKAQFAYSLTEDIKVGGGFGYDTASYISLFGRVIYDLPVMDGLYAFGDLGWRFGIGGKEGSLFLNLGAGYEKSVGNDFILFGEVEAQMVFAPEIRVMPSLVFGARYSF